MVVEENGISVIYMSEFYFVRSGLVGFILILILLNKEPDS